MIRINQLKLPIDHQEHALKEKVSKLLKIPKSQIESLEIIKKSIDARKKTEIVFVYSLEASVKQEDKIWHRINNPNIIPAKSEAYQFPKSGTENLKHPPVMIGSGPAGLFCALMLAEHGYPPIVLERGEPVEDRKKAVDNFWRLGVLKKNSNVQFGEGGAGTFSDGKLNTLVKDPYHRNRKVLEVFAASGAGEEILFFNKPHIGTDVLGTVVKNIRNKIISLGGQVCFNSQMTDIFIEKGQVTGIEVNHDQVIHTETLVLAIGHSARDTFEMLNRHPLLMTAKAFAVGLRIQHPQKMINASQYGREDSPYLPAAEYKLTKQCANGRGVYSFCMCPGGYVVDASSEEERLAVNGMSYHSRNGQNANSALIVTVTPRDYAAEGPLAGMIFQRNLEHLAYRLGDGHIPVQLFGDFCKDQESANFKEVIPAFKGKYQFSNLRRLLPEAISQCMIEGIQYFDQKIPGFGRTDAILAGIESRTSSPIRIERNENLESNLKGIFPCGEGAGYAGGITSAAMDGIRVAEEIAKRYKKLR